MAMSRRSGKNNSATWDFCFFGHSVTLRCPKTAVCLRRGVLELDQVSFNLSLFANFAQRFTHLCQLLFGAADPLNAACYLGFIHLFAMCVLLLWGRGTSFGPPYFTERSVKRDKGQCRKRVTTKEENRRPKHRHRTPHLLREFSRSLAKSSDQPNLAGW